MIDLFITVPDLPGIAAAGFTQIKVYRDTTETGSFATLAGTVNLVSGQESYNFIDTAGDATSWYKTSYSGPTPGETAKGVAHLGTYSSSYATVTEFKNQIEKVGSTKDVEIQALLDAATEAIFRICNRKDGFVAAPNPVARLFPGSGTFVQYIDQFVSVSLVEVKSSPSNSSYDTWASGDYLPFAGDEVSPNFNPLPFGPYSGLMVTATGTSRIFTSGMFNNMRGFNTDMARLSNNSLGRNLPTVRVTARWGFADVVPAPIKQACLAQAARWWKRGSSAWNDSMASSDTGAVTYRKALDPDVKLMTDLARFIRPAIG